MLLKYVDRPAPTIWKQIVAALKACPPGKAVAVPRALSASSVSGSLKRYFPTQHVHQRANGKVRLVWVDKRPTRRTAP